jgi:hypothetical protein
MKLFKDNQNNIYAYELDGSQDHLIGEKVALTQAEIDAREAKLLEEKAQAEADAQAVNDAKASALAKLAALGLTDAEVKALIGA